MRATLAWIFLFSTISFAWAALSLRASGRYPDDDDPMEAKNKSPDAVDYRGVVRPGTSAAPDQQMAGRHNLTRLAFDEGQGPTTATLSAGYDRHVPTASGSRRFVSIWFEYRLKAGELVPMLDAMYRVTELKVDTWIRLKRVTDKDLVKNLSDDRNLLIVPVGTHIRYVFDENRRRLDDTSNVAVKSTAAGRAPDSHPTATAFLENEAGLNPGRAATIMAKKEIQVNVGDVLPMVMGCQLTVKKIVLPDKEHNIVGWVEFSPDPPKRGGTGDGK